MKPRELVVLLHGVGGTAASWRGISDALLPDYEVLAPNLVRAAEPTNVAMLADDVAEAIARSGHTRAHIVGHSLGGAVALELFRRHRRRVASLGVISGWAQVAPVDYRPLLSRIDVPLLLIGGALDQLTPVDPVLTSIRAGVPSARLVNVPAAGHQVYVDEPDLVVHALRTHLRGATYPGKSHGDGLLPVDGDGEAAWWRLVSQRGVRVVAATRPVGETPAGITIFPVETPGAFAVADGYARVARRPIVVWTESGAGLTDGIAAAKQAHTPVIVGVNAPVAAGKWSSELVMSLDGPTVFDRALAIAQSEPAGPVLLHVREESNPTEAAVSPLTRRQTPLAPVRASEDAIEQVAARIRAAKSPLIVAERVGRLPGGMAALVRFARAAGVGVVEPPARLCANFPTAHPHHLGFDPAAVLAGVDLIIAVEATIPASYLALSGGVPPTVIAIAADPLRLDQPGGPFAIDEGLPGDPVQTLRALADELDPQGLRGYRLELAAHHARLFGAWRDRIAQLTPGISMGTLSRAIEAAIDETVVLFSDAALDAWVIERNVPDNWFSREAGPWALAAAIGGKLAAPERPVLAVYRAAAPIESPVPILEIAVFSAADAPAGAIDQAAVLVTRLLAAVEQLREGIGSRIDVIGIE